jgi:division protein CdvB (Snf7/Vps24/ESCRT-III family)
VRAPAEGQRIRGFIRSSPPPLRETATRSIHALRVQQGRLNQASFRLRERHKVLFETCVGAYEKNNKDRATVFAGEVAEVRKLIKFLYDVELAIERVILRLETIRELSDIVVDLKPSLRLLQRVSQDLLEVLPDVSSELTKVNETISETLYSTKITADASMIPVERKTPGGEEILNEVTMVVEQKLSEALPEPPVTLKIQEAAQNTLKEMVALTTNVSEKSTHKSIEESGKDSSQTLISYKKSEIKEISLKVENHQLEEILLDYLRKRNGQIDLEKCSVDLSTSNEEIEKALESLGSKGRIKVELKTGE